MAGRLVAGLDANIELSILQTPIAFGVHDDKTAYGDRVGSAVLNLMLQNYRHAALA